MTELDIIIPQYKESTVTIKNSLDSIACQKGIAFKDIRVLIINDCSNVIISNELFKNYNFKIEYLKNEKNLGPGLTRQKALDYSNAKYVMFLDADDVLYSDIAIYVMLSCIKETKKKLVITNFLAEAFDKNDKMYLKEYTNGNLYSALHAKLFELDFLKKNNIRFSDKLRDFEDSYFMSILLGSLKNEDVIKLNISTYLWKSNENSITRSEKNDYIISRFDDFFNCPFYVYDFLKNINTNYKYDYIISAIFGIFIMLNGEFKDNIKKNKYLELLKEKIVNFKNVFEKYKDDELILKFNQEYKQLDEASKVIGKITYNDFIKFMG